MGLRFTVYFSTEDGREISMTAPKFKRWLRGGGPVMHDPTLPAVVITNVHVRVGDEIPPEGVVLPAVPLIELIKSLLTVMVENGYWCQRDTDVADRSSEIILACEGDCGFDPTAEENPYLEIER